MLFILIGLGLLLIIAILITLFSMDIQLGLLGIMILIMTLILLGRKIMKVQNFSKQKEQACLDLNLRNSFGEVEGKEIKEKIFLISKNKSYRDQNILYINEMYRISDENGKESVLKLLQKLSET